MDAFALVSPPESMRDMTTDRPDVTESPYTVDAGHVQVEVDALSAELDEGVTELWVAHTAVRLGLTRSTEVQLVVEPWRHVEGLTGVGDLTLRGKLNLWGNDSGPTALGLMPFARLPTADAGLGTGHVEGGLLLLLGFRLPAGWELSTMLAAAAADHDDHYGPDLIATGSLAYEFVSEVSGYLEPASVLPLEHPGQLDLTVNGGLVLVLGDDLAIDGGARVGLTDAATGLALFVGGSARY